MNALKQHKWEVTHITSITAAIIIVALVTHLTGTARPERAPVRRAIATTSSSPWHPSVPIQPLDPAHSAQSSLRHPYVRSRPANPREITVGATGISNRYTLLGVDRKPSSTTSDDLTVRLQVESLAMENLVSPFGSDMLELHNRDLNPISPIKSFSHPIPSGNTLTQDVIFSIPTSLSLTHTTLKIHYYNYQKEIPLNLPPRDGAEP